LLTPSTNLAIRPVCGAPDGPPPRRLRRRFFRVAPEGVPPRSGGGSAGPSSRRGSHLPCARGRAFPL